jgi:hypothetical protein
VTLRDAITNHNRLDFVRKSWDSNRLTRPTDLHRKWSFIDQVRLQKGNLVWRTAEPKRLDQGLIFDGQVERRAVFVRRQAEQAGRGVLDDFLALRAGPSRAILKYARTWGVLELCRHNLPACHDFSHGIPLRLTTPLLAKSAKLTQCVFDLDLRQCQPLGAEPLTTWRFFASQAWALVSIAADLQRGRLGAKDLWSIVLRDGVTPSQSIQAQQQCLREAVEGWLKLGRIKPTIDDLSGGLTWTGADLFGELAVQVALAIGGTDGQVLCIVCGKPYASKRRVTKHGFNYCPAPPCQREAAAQRAKRYRQRKRSGSHGSVRDLPYRGLYHGRTNDPLFSQ